MVLNKRATLLLVLALAWAVPCAAEEEVAPPDYGADFRDAARVEGDALSDWLLMGKLGQPVGRFVAMPPAIPEGEDADLFAALLLQNADDYALDTPSRLELEQRLLPAASQNSYIALVLMDSAGMRGDVEAQVLALAAGAAASEYRGPFVPALRSLLPRLGSVPSQNNAGLPPDLHGYGAAFELAVSMAVPSFNRWMTLCKYPAPELREDCASFAITMRYDAQTAIEAIMAAAVIDFHASADPKNPSTEARAEIHRLLARLQPLLENLEDLPEEQRAVFLETMLAEGELVAMRRLHCLHRATDRAAAAAGSVGKPAISPPAPCGYGPTRAGR